MKIKIEDYISKDEIKEIVLEKVKDYVDYNVENTIKCSIQYAFYDILGKEYLTQLPKLVNEKIKEITVTDIIGYPDGSSFKNSEARNILNQALRDNKEKLQEIILDKFSKMDEYDAKEIIIKALTLK